MSSRLLLLVALLGIFAAPVGAKPPDLPVDTSITCPSPIPQPASPDDLRFSQPIQYPKEVLNQALRPTVSVLDEDDDPVKDILVNVEEKRTGSLMFGLGVNSDAGLTGSVILNPPACMCCQAEETPIDGLWFGLLERDEEPTPYTELLLNTLFPPLRLRHLSPANVKAFVEEMKPHFDATVEHWREMVGHCFADNTPEGLDVHRTPKCPPTNGYFFPTTRLYTQEEINALQREVEEYEVPVATPPTCTHSPDEVKDAPPPRHAPTSPSCPTVCPYAGRDCHPDAEEEDADEESGDDSEAQEPPVGGKTEEADKDCWEVQIQVKNVRTGEVVKMPKMFLEDCQPGSFFLQDYGAAIRVQMAVQSLKPAPPTETAPMPHEVTGSAQEQEDAPAAAPQSSRIGEIIVVGNTTTPKDVILKEIPFESGMEIGPSHIEMAEKNLAATGLFVVDPAKGVRPTVQVLYADSEAAVKDVLVTVEEKTVKCPDAEEQEDVPPQAMKRCTVGQIIVVGNTCTPENVILNEIPFKSGAEITYADLHIAEKNLIALNLFNVDPEKGIHPTVSVLDEDSDNSVKDILVNVEESDVSVAKYGQGGEAKPESEDESAPLPLHTPSCPPPPNPPAVIADAEEEDAPPQAQKHFNVGRIIIVGNTHTPDNVIRDALHFCPGMEISSGDVCVAEKNLARLFGFLPAPHKYSVARPKVEVLDIESDSEFKDILVTVEETTASRCTDWGEESEPPAEDKPTPTCPPAVSPEPECTCPYLKEQKQKKTETVDPDKVFKDDVLDNLDKLTRARKAFDKAEFYRNVGDLAAAAYMYTKVKEICPGSRFDVLATKCLEEIAAEQTNDNPDPVTPMEPEEDNSTESEDVGEQMFMLFTPFHIPCVFACDESAVYARIYMAGQMLLGCCNCNCSALIWKTHACLPLPPAEPTYPGCHTETEDEDVQPPDQPKVESDKDIHAALFIARMFRHPLKDEAAARCIAGLFGPLPRHHAHDWFSPVAQVWKEFLKKTSVEPAGATEEAEPKDEVPPGDGAQPYDVRIQPPLPPIDPKIVETMEKVLKESGDPTRAKLIVLPEPASDPAEQEEPVSQWPLVPPEVEMPSLFVDPDADLDLDDSDDAADPTPPNAAAGEVFQQALDAVKKGLYVDIDGFDDQSGEPSVTLAVGGLEFRVMLDGEGHRYFLVGLLPEATRDLKLMQQSLNERVQHWIEQMNGGGNKVEEPAEDGADDEDDDGGDDDDTGV